VITLRTFLSHF